MHGCVSECAEELHYRPDTRTWGSWILALCLLLAWSLWSRLKFLWFYKTKILPILYYFESKWDDVSKMSVPYLTHNKHNKFKLLLFCECFFFIDVFQCGNLSRYWNLFHFSTGELSMKLKRKMLAFELRSKHLSLTLSASWWSHWLVQEVAAQFLTIMGNSCGNGVCPRRGRMGRDHPGGAPQPASCWEQLPPGAGAHDPQPLGRWGSGRSPVNLSGGGRGAAPRAERFSEAAICRSREGKLASCQKTLRGFYFGWRDFWNCEMEFFLLRSESFLFFFF